MVTIVSYRFGTNVVPFLEIKPGKIEYTRLYGQDMKFFCSPNDQGSGVAFYDKVRLSVPKSWPRFLRFLEPQTYTDGLKLSDIRIVEHGVPLELPHVHLVVEHLKS